MEKPTDNRSLLVFLLTGGKAGNRVAACIALCVSIFFLFTPLMIEPGTEWRYAICVVGALILAGYTFATVRNYYGKQS